MDRSHVPLQAWESAIFHAEEKYYVFDLHLENLRRLHRTMILTVVSTVTLSSLVPGIFALPALALSPDPSPVQLNTSSILIPPNPHPPQEPTCPSTEQWGITLGHPSYDDCDYILTNLYPKDPLARPVTRNFYAAHSDVSHTMSNFRLPYEQSHGKQFSPIPSTVRGCFHLLIFEKGHVTSRYF